MIGKIEQIGYNLDGKTDTLYLSNGEANLWIFSFLTGYKQVGKFTVEKPHDYKENDWVEIEFESPIQGITFFNKIVSVKKISEKEWLE